MRIVIVFLLEDIVKNKIFKTFNRFSIQSLKVKVKVTHLCLTLCDPIDYTVHGNLQARILEWVAFPFSRGIFPTRGSNPGLPHFRQLFTSWESPLPAKKVLTPSSCWETGIDIYIAGRFLPAEPQGKSKNTGVGNNNKGLLSLLLSKINYLIKFSHWSMLLP